MVWILVDVFASKKDDNKVMRMTVMMAMTAEMILTMMTIVVSSALLHCASAR